MAKRVRKTGEQADHSREGEGDQEVTSELDSDEDSEDSHSSCATSREKRKKSVRVSHLDVKESMRSVEDAATQATHADTWRRERSAKQEQLPG